MSSWHAADPSAVSGKGSDSDLLGVSACWLGGCIDRETAASRVGPPVDLPVGWEGPQVDLPPEEEGTHLPVEGVGPQVDLPIVGKGHPAVVDLDAEEFLVLAAAELRAVVGNQVAAGLQVAGVHLAVVGLQVVVVGRPIVGDVPAVVVGPLTVVEVCAVFEISGAFAAAEC